MTVCGSWASPIWRFSTITRSSGSQFCRGIVAAVSAVRCSSAAHARNRSCGRFSCTASGKRSDRPHRTALRNAHRHGIRRGGRAYRAPARVRRVDRRQFVTDRLALYDYALKSHVAAWRVRRRHRKPRRRRDKDAGASVRSAPRNRQDWDGAGLGVEAEARGHSLARLAKTRNALQQAASNTSHQAPRECSAPGTPRP
jgi:hypothetical protein